MYVYRVAASQAVVASNCLEQELNGGEPSDAFEEEGGESMWELYVKDNGEAKAKRVFEERAAQERCARLRAPCEVL